MIRFPLFGKKQFKIKPVVLVILDGFGLAPASKGNAVSLAKTTNIHRFMKIFPHTELIASGESVGLPANEVGNTEVGHLTLGAGRTILQDLKRISEAIKKGTFFDNRALLAAVNHVKQNNSKLHILGLVSSGNVHSSIDHLWGLLQFCKKESVAKVYLHLFTDGRDAPPNEGIEIIEKVQKHLEDIKIGKIASISGRYFAMDRDRRWERTEKAYKAIVSGLGIQATSAIGAVKNAYSKGETDEFIEPGVIFDNNTPCAVIDDNDAIVFFNYRIDRARQITMALSLPNFETLKSFDFGQDSETPQKAKSVEIGTTFKREKVPKNLYLVTMTEYHKDLPVSAVAYPPEVVELPLGEILSQNGLKQLHMAESEKERFVTYYFNGLREERFAGEDVAIVASPKVGTYDKKPEMSLPKLVSEFKKLINRDFYHFAVINFANPDMVAHSGDLSATIAAIEVVDKYLGVLMEKVLAQDGVGFITADHGNAEELLTFPTGSFFITSQEGTINTDHSSYPVPLIVAGNQFKGSGSILPKGGLADVAPTILNVMGIRPPEVMTGRNLLDAYVK